MTTNNTIGGVWKTHDMVRVNVRIFIPTCTFDNQVLYTLDDTNYLDLRDSDIRWFARSSDVWDAL